MPRQLRRVVLALGLLLVAALAATPATPARADGHEPEPRVRRDTVLAAVLFVAGFSSVLARVTRR